MAVITPCEKSALAILQLAIKEYRGNIAVAYSGGKDSIVLMHLVTRCITEHFYPDFPTVIFLDVPMEDPVSECVRQFAKNSMDEPEFMHYPFYTIRCKSVKEGIHKCANFKAIIMGTRRTDPSGSHFDAHGRAFTTGDWPPMMRVAPLLNWTNDDIWTYIDHHKLTYPDIYKQGYTSTGATGTHSPHPELRQADGTYKHARFLANSSNERQERKEEKIDNDDPYIYI